MQGWRLIWAGGAAVALGLAGFLGCSRDPLPADVAGAARPAPLRSALGAARQAARGLAPEPLRHLAHLYQANALLAPARACYELLGRKSAFSARDHYYLALIAQTQGEPGMAERELRATLAADPGYLPAQVRLAAVLADAGKGAEAAQVEAAILAAEPYEPETDLAVARRELQSGAGTRAAARLEALWAAHPDYTPAGLLLASLLEHQGQPARAAALRAWIRGQPDPLVVDPWQDELLADCYDLPRLQAEFARAAAAGHLEAVRPELDRVAELDPASPIPDVLLAWTLARTNQDAAAIAPYRAALARGADPLLVCPDLVASLLALRRVADAQTVMDQALAGRPHAYPLLVAAAEVAEAQADWPRARPWLEEAAAQGPSDHASALRLAALLWKGGLVTETFSCLDRLTSLYADDVASRALLGEDRLRHGDPAAAVAPLEDAQALAALKLPGADRVPGLLADALVGQGMQAAHRGQRAVAVAAYSRAIEVAPAQRDAYVYLADEWFGARQFGRAAEVLARLAALPPPNGRVVMRLGDALYLAGDRAAARSAWEKAGTLFGPSATESRAALDRRLRESAAPGASAAAAPAK